MLKNSIYQNRTDAGKKLIPILKDKISSNTVLFAIPRGGVEVAAPIASHFKLPIHLLMVKKISHPNNIEMAIGACGLTEYVINSHSLLTENELEITLHQLRDSLQHRLEVYGFKDSPENLKSKSVILIDDGIATGATVQCGIRELRKLNPDRIVLAVPVAASDATQFLTPLVDEFICPSIKQHLQAIGTYYDDFLQVSDSEVREFLLLNRNIS
jgi:putative phosphoribosyl transferase